MASRGLSNLGSGTSSTLTSVTPFQQTAFMRPSFSHPSLACSKPIQVGHWLGKSLLKLIPPIPSHAHVPFHGLISQNSGCVLRSAHLLKLPRLSPSSV